MKIVTWNVNSINARIEHLAKFIKKDQSDIYLIHELKCISQAFPYEKIEKLGYNCYVNGQKAWNGVAFLSKNKLKILNKKIPTFNEDMQSRFLETEIKINKILRIICTDSDSCRKSYYYKSCKNCLIHPTVNKANIG